MVNKKGFSLIEIFASSNVNRVYTHYAVSEMYQYSGGIVDQPLQADTIKIMYWIWGGGGGHGGYDKTGGGHGTNGGAGGSVIGETKSLSLLPSGNILNIMVGSKGGNGANDGGAGGIAGAGGAAYGYSGRGGTTGLGGGGSGAGGGGGGMTMLSVNNSPFVVAGGGGGGGGGSNSRPVNITGSNCSAQTTSFYGGVGESAPSDGDGGGGGGGGYYGGKGGTYGLDNARTATSGCFGGSWSLNPKDDIANPSGTTPGHYTDANRPSAIGLPQSNGLAIIREKVSTL